MHLQIESFINDRIHQYIYIKEKKERVVYVRNVTTKPVTQFYFKEDYWTFWGGDQLLTFQILIFIYLWYNLKKNIISGAPKLIQSSTAPGCSN